MEQLKTGADTAIRVMLDGCIDYAGLFPPAGLSMDEAVRNYAQYRGSDDAWALGRFILPVARLGEFEASFAGLRSNNDSVGGWQLSALAGASPVSDADVIHGFNERYTDIAVIDAIEAKTATLDDVSTLAEAAGGSLTIYCEAALDHNLPSVIEAIKGRNLRAKVRTGGVTPEIFPSPEKLLSFVSMCNAEKLPFKATAGLHHPLRAEYPLTYAHSSATGTMFGFLNVILATAFTHVGIDQRDALAMLTERTPDSFTFSDDAIIWRNHHLTLRTLELIREQLFISFGSCSFTEPLADLRTIQFL